MTPAQFFNMSVSAVARLATPRYLRVGVIFQHILALVSATVGYLNTDFVSFRNNTLAQIGYDGSIVALEHLLNLRYYGTWNPLAASPIFITGRAGERPLYVFPVADNSPIYIYPVGHPVPIQLFPAAELSTSAFDFTVNVPVALVFSAVEMRSLIDRYRVAGPTYTIVTY